MDFIKVLFVIRHFNKILDYELRKALMGRARLKESRNG